MQTRCFLSISRSARITAAFDLPEPVLPSSARWLSSTGSGRTGRLPGIALRDALDQRGAAPDRDVEATAAIVAFDIPADSATWAIEEILAVAIGAAAIDTLDELAADLGRRQSRRCADRRRLLDLPDRAGRVVEQVMGHPRPARLATGMGDRIFEAAQD